MFLFKSRKPQQDVQQFLLRLGNRATSGRTRYADDRRLESRTIVNLGVCIIPIKGNEPDTDAAFTAVTRDVNSAGLGIMSRRSLSAETVLVRLPGEPTPRLLRAEVLDSRSLGCGWLLYSLKATELLDTKMYPELVQAETLAEV